MILDGAPTRSTPAVIVIDTDEKVHGLLPELDELIAKGLAMLDPAEVVPHIGASSS